MNYITVKQLKERSDRRKKKFLLGIQPEKRVAQLNVTNKIILEVVEVVDVI